CQFQGPCFAPLRLPANKTVKPMRLRRTAYLAVRLQMQSSVAHSSHLSAVVALRPAAFFQALHFVLVRLACSVPCAFVVHQPLQNKPRTDLAAAGFAFALTASPI